MISSINVQRTKVSITYTTPPDIRARMMRNGLVVALKDLAKWWQKAMLPAHFMERAYYVYHYQIRKAKYTKRKFKKYGHRKPNVYSGTLMSRALNGNIRVKNYGALPASRPSRTSVEPKNASADVYIAGLPRYSYLVPNPRYKGPDKIRELGTVNKNEAPIMARQLTAFANKYWADKKQPVTVKG